MFESKNLKVKDVINLKKHVKMELKEYSRSEYPPYPVFTIKAPNLRKKTYEFYDFEDFSEFLESEVESQTVYCIKEQETDNEN